MAPEKWRSSCLGLNVLNRCKKCICLMKCYLCVGAQFICQDCVHSWSKIRMFDIVPHDHTIPDNNDPWIEID